MWHTRCLMDQAGVQKLCIANGCRRKEACSQATSPLPLPIVGCPTRDICRVEEDTGSTQHLALLGGYAVMQCQCFPVVRPIPQDGCEGGSEPPRRCAKQARGSRDGSTASNPPNGTEAPYSCRPAPVGARQPGGGQRRTFVRN
jgi:hypothetical protein